MKHITKPIDLIVAETMHRYASNMQTARMFLKEMREAKPDLHQGRTFDEAVRHIGIDVREELARTLLCKIAHDARVGDVLKALQSVGAPATLDFIADGLKAVEESQ